MSRKVIDLQKSRQASLDRRSAQERSRRMNLILQTFQCARCAMKCAKCGCQLDAPSSNPRAQSVPYRLCESCLQEYEELLERMHGRGNPEYYWHNREWMDLWKAWMNYQDALSRYALSQEFRRLLRDVGEADPE